MPASLVVKNSGLFSVALKSVCASFTPVCAWTSAQADATNVPYKFASNYFDVNMSAADWSVKTATGAITLGTVSIDPQRGTRYTIVALPSSSTVSSTYLIVDPSNKPPGSSSSHLRVMNATRRSTLRTSTST